MCRAATHRLVLVLALLVGPFIQGSALAQGEPPSIAPVPSQTTIDCGSPVSVPVSLTDPDTASELLRLSATSSNTNLLPNTSIAVSGAGSNRTVTLVPVRRQRGTTLITLTASDGTTETRSQFRLTVVAVLESPVLAPIADQLMGEDRELNIPINIIFGPCGGEDEYLSLSATSSNPELFPAASFVFSKTTTNYMLQLKPAADQNGHAVVTVLIGNGENVVRGSFFVDVSPVNDPPSISEIPEQVGFECYFPHAIPFTISDPDTPTDSLSVTFSSSNTNFLPNANISVSGTGTNRTLTVAPLPFDTGASDVTVSVSDGFATDSVSFRVIEMDNPGAPLLGPIPNQTVLQNTVASTPIFATVPCKTYDDLNFSARSDNETLLPASGLIVLKTSTNATLMIRPSANQNGKGHVAISMDSGVNVARASFDVTVIPENDPPGSAAAQDETVFSGVRSRPFEFSPGSVDTRPEILHLAAASDNEGLIASSNITFSVTTTNIGFAVQPVAERTVLAIVTLTANDGSLTSTSHFRFWVLPQPTGTVRINRSQTNFMVNFSSSMTADLVAESSADLNLWSTVATNRDSMMLQLNQLPAGPARFYRIRINPPE